MPGAHRHGDSRFCGASTIVEGQSTVYVNGKLWAVEGDPETHIDGNLIAVYGAKNVHAEGKLVIVAVGDKATPDDAGHPGPPTDPKGHSSDVSAYGGAAGGGS
jgi:uncharacterized Zn-binding protein involved in type VI secretion